MITHTGKSIKATPLTAYPPKGRATGGVRSHAFRKGETQLVLSTVSTTGSLYTSEGKVISPKTVTPKRDASGEIVKDSELF